MKNRFELDHLFVCTDVGAPRAEMLIQYGFTEGPSNQHPGQGTANRRFFFSNAMVELIWVNDAAEAQSPNSRRTLLWERWRDREKVSPFGICMRPTGDQEAPSPFPGWEYRPAYLPDPMSMRIGEAGVLEPMWVYLGFMRRSHHEQHQVEHRNGAHEITALTLTTPFALRSPASRIVIESGVLTARYGAESLLEIEFDHGHQKSSMDLRPHLPLILRI